MMTNSTEIKYFQNDLEIINEVEQEIINEIELDDLESIVKTEFAQGLPSDIEINAW